MRQADQKRHAVEALRGSIYNIIAAGDSHNDLAMLQAADEGIPLCPTDAFAAANSEFPVTRDHAALRAQIEKFLAQNATPFQETNFRPLCGAGVRHHRPTCMPPLIKLTVGSSGAFCKITPDYLTSDPAKCNVIHADGSGTKSLVAYMQWKETGDLSVFRGIAQDSLVMNLDDLLCIGATGPIVFSSTINRNSRRFSADALAELIAGNEAFLTKLRGLGIEAVSRWRRNRRRGRPYSDCDRRYLRCCGHESLSGHH